MSVALDSVVAPKMRQADEKFFNFFSWKILRREDKEVRGKNEKRGRRKR